MGVAGSPECGVERKRSEDQASQRHLHSSEGTCWDRFTHGGGSDRCHLKRRHGQGACDGIPQRWASIAMFFLTIRITTAFAKSSNEVNNHCFALRDSTYLFSRSNSRCNRGDPEGTAPHFQRSSSPPQNRQGADHDCCSCYSAFTRSVVGCGAIPHSSCTQDIHRLSQALLWSLLQPTRLLLQLRLLPIARDWGSRTGRTRRRLAVGRTKVVMGPIGAMGQL